jgi:hypothetical protein
MATRTPRKPSTKRVPISPAKQAQLAAEREAKVAEAAEILKKAVADLMTADGWQAMIEARLWLRKYSFQNLMLIMVQCPGATDVRPYGAKVNPSPNSWKAVGRFARQGEAAIRIFAPMFKKNDDGEQVLYGFKLVPVFDVSQTDGEPLPPVADNKVELLTGDAPAELWERTEKLIVGLGFSVQRGPCEGYPEANGLTEWGPKRVTVRSDVDDAQAAKTLLHELAHIMLGHGDERGETGREQCEVEAESVACIVTRYAGLVSLPYSVGYVAGWAGTLELVEESAKIVLRTADAIVADLGL